MSCVLLLYEINYKEMTIVSFIRQFHLSRHLEIDMTRGGWIIKQGFVTSAKQLVKIKLGSKAILNQNMKSKIFYT